MEYSIYSTSIYSYSSTIPKIKQLLSKLFPYLSFLTEVKVKTVVYPSNGYTVLLAPPTLLAKLRLSTVGTVCKQI